MNFCSYRKKNGWFIEMVHADVGNDVCSFISAAKFLWRLVQAPLLIKVGTHDATSRRD